MLGMGFTHLTSSFHFLPADVAVRGQYCSLVAPLRWDPMCLVQLLHVVCEFPIKHVEDVQDIPDGRMEAGPLTNTLPLFSLQKVQMSQHQL